MRFDEALIRLQGGYKVTNPLFPSDSFLFIEDGTLKILQSDHDGFWNVDTREFNFDCFLRDDWEVVK